MANERPRGNWSNRAKQLCDPSPGPWETWRINDRAARAIHFVETFCRAPKGYGSGELLTLAPFQQAWLEEVLADGVNSAAMSVARGNGKSTFLAAVALWALFDEDRESGAPQVPIIATKVMQAYRSVYGVALAMISAEPELRDRCLVYTASNAMKVTVPANGGEMFPTSNDVAGLQGLDPSLAICDEVGFMPIESWDSLLLASGKRPRSLVVGIGTPGLDQDNALWHLRHRVLEGGRVPGFVYTEYAAPEGCELRDEDMWSAANPALAAGYMNPAALRTAVELSPEGHFRIFHLGQWVDGVESWLGDDGGRVWNALRDPYKPISGDSVWCGVDIGQSVDSSAVVAVAWRPDGRLHAWCRMWVPAKDQTVDVADVNAYLRELDREYRLERVAYDPRLFDLAAIELEEEGLPMVKVPQSVERMIPATMSTYDLIRRGGLSHDGDPAFDLHVLNAVIRPYESGFRLSKPKSRGKIDAAIALVLAADGAVREPPASDAFVV